MLFAFAGTAQVHFWEIQNDPITRISMRFLFLALSLGLVGLAAAAPAAAPASAPTAPPTSTAAVAESPAPILMVLPGAGLPLGAVLLLPTEDPLPKGTGPASATFGGQKYTVVRRAGTQLSPALAALAKRPMTLYDDKGARCTANIGEVLLVKFGYGTGNMISPTSSAKELDTQAARFWDPDDSFRIWRQAYAFSLTGDTASCAGAMFAVPADKKATLVKLQGASQLESEAFSALNSSGFAESASEKDALEHTSASVVPVSARILRGSVGPSLMLVYLKAYGRRQIAFYAMALADSMKGARWLGVGTASSPSRVTGVEIEAEGEVAAVVSHANGVAVVRQHGTSWNFDNTLDASPLKNLTTNM